MTGMWVAVTAEVNGSTFSHRSEELSPWATDDNRALHTYNRLLDDASHRVRRGLAGSLPLQLGLLLSTPLSDHEKIRAICGLLDDEYLDNAQTITDIHKVLSR